MGRRRMHAAFILYKTLGYPELRYILLWMKALITTVSMEKRMERLKNIIMILLLMNLAMYLTQ